MRGTVLASLAFGAALGLIDPHPLYSVEIAQWVSGVMQLPPSAPMTLHHDSAFSLVVDVAAVLLRAGLTEDLVCRLLSVVMAALSSLSVTLVAFAITSNTVVALAAPVITLAHLVAPPDIPIHKYNYYFPISHSDLGVFGFSTALIALACVAIDPRRGAWLLPVALAVHPSFGLAALAIVGVGCLFDRQTRNGLVQQWRAIGASALVVALIWLVHDWMMGPEQPRPPIDRALVNAEIRWWDMHRAPLLPPGTGVGQVLLQFWYDALFLIAAGIALSIRPPVLERVRFWITGAVVITIAVSGVTIADEFWPAWGPLPLHALMLSRWLNFNMVLLPLLVAALALPDGRLPRWIPGRVAIAVVGCAMAGAFVYKVSSTGHYDVFPRRHAAFFERFAKRPGLYVVGGEPSGFEFIQLATRRTVLFDPIVDVLPYAPAMAGPVERILREVWGVSLLDPANWEQFEQVRARWQARAPEEWRAVLQKHGVTDIIVPSSWTLQLPRADASGEFAMYSIAP